VRIAATSRAKFAGEHWPRQQVSFHFRLAVPQGTAPVRHMADAVAIDQARGLAMGWYAGRIYLKCERLPGNAKPP
jgi:hypothetical protein